MIPGGIDCDIHPTLPGLRSLFPYLPEHWCEILDQQGMHELVSNNYPPGAPLSLRPDWRPEAGPPAQLAHIRSHALDPWETRAAICNCLYGVQLLFNEDMAAAIARAMNEWMARELLDLEPRLRASIIVPMQNPGLAVEEIERWADDARFVQVLLLVMGDMPLGRRVYWPVYAAAEKHGLPVGIHAGSAYHNPTTPTGWPSYHGEDYVNQAQAFQTQLGSLIYEGVFGKFPGLRVVLIESGFTWLPACLWRLTKFWRGLRPEVPWVDRSPAQIVREHVRLTLQPVDGPPDAEQFERFWEHMGSDALLLFSSDYPHWQFEGDTPLPPGLPNALARKIMVDNPIATYPRLKEVVS
ncbi:MAG: amidohydrolase [Acidisphaera sp.]|nr:amidohydrolase [Acidisphaera sp.]